MPPLEAAFFGAPLLVSNIDVFKENLGTAAQYVDPVDTAAIAHALTAALAEPARLLQNADRSAEVARTHNWVTTVMTMRTHVTEMQSHPSRLVSRA